MIQFLYGLFAFIVALGLLVAFHEYGHFWVARRLGIRVLKFSIGFGKSLYSWKDKKQTEYILAAIPLGGFVKMLDEREGPVPNDQLNLAFNRRPVWQRIAVVLAGPMANMVLAVVLYWIIFMIGVEGVIPIVGTVQPDSLVGHAGLPTGSEILSIDDEKTPTWQNVVIHLVSRLGETGDLKIEVREPQSQQLRIFHIPLEHWDFDSTKQEDPTLSLGFSLDIPPIVPVIDSVEPDGAAAEAGFEVGDKVIAVNNTKIADWKHFVEQIQHDLGKSVLVDVERHGELKALTVVPREHLGEGGHPIGFIGVGVKPTSFPKDRIRFIQYSPLQAIVPAFKKTWSYTWVTLETLKKMVIGEISVKNVSGPISIARGAGQSWQVGIDSFLGFLALISISLGVLNLLPIPVLDGGHLLYYVIELVRGRPLSEKMQAAGYRIGMLFLLGLMILAFYNDIARL